MYTIKNKRYWRARGAEAGFFFANAGRPFLIVKSKDIVPVLILFSLPKKIPFFFPNIPEKEPVGRLRDLPGFAPLWTDAREIEVDTLSPFYFSRIYLSGEGNYRYANKRTRHTCMFCACYWRRNQRAASCR